MKIEKLTVNYHGIPVGVLSLTPDIVYCRCGGNVSSDGLQLLDR